ncbi:MAG: hypothetical protein LBR72_08460 [Oscillospiraceae bacterium]|jgi:hypothetical protein|nr:hypothetical protein [Oscillospiraceae bacterium]
MTILRVFPRRTSYTPDDSMALIGHPALREVYGQCEIPRTRTLPPHDQVHISCVFTWDIPLCERLRELYQRDTDKPVLVGGPAYNSPARDFTPGLYVRRNIVFTSRGCDNNCGFCSVPEREGKIAELLIHPGNVIQDNNFLQTSREHKEKVFAMLKRQSGICFKGGLQNSLIDAHFVENVRALRISELWLACDSDAAIPGLERAAEKLTKAGYTREHIRCYALIGDDMDANERRLQAIYAAGAMPFAMLYQPTEGTERKQYSRDWRKFQTMWARPAATVAHVTRGTSMWDY